ncbi:unnamed protein product [Brugia timori]|uniref:Uncharacterized protein n=1 Tax=Brugia timori TaxID=42155 RepID=A0A0R3R663_9BILA|nr:unnamed protein product [Brugia timori]
MWHKDVVRHIGEQLSTTQMAFHYDDIPHEYITMSQPPPYADTCDSDLLEDQFVNNCKCANSEFRNVRFFIDLSRFNICLASDIFR